jgi:hypothetical protein
MAPRVHPAQRTATASSLLCSPLFFSLLVLGEPGQQLLFPPQPQHKQPAVRSISIVPYMG